MRNTVLAALITPWVLAGDARAQEIRFQPLVVDGRQFKEQGLTVSVSNPAGGPPVRLEIEFAAHAQFRVRPAGMEVALGPGERKTLRPGVSAARPVSVANIAPLEVSIGVWRGDAVEPERSLRWLPVHGWLPCPLRRGATHIDGRLAEWGHTAMKALYPSQRQGDSLRWSGPEDASMEFSVALGERALFVAAKVRDDQVEPEHDALALVYESPSGPALIRVGPGEVSAETKRYNAESWPDGTLAACLKTLTGYQAEFAIPIAALAPRDASGETAYRLNFAITDRDTGDPDDLVLWWRPVWNSADDVAVSGLFVVSRGPAARRGVNFR